MFPICNISGLDGVDILLGGPVDGHGCPDILLGDTEIWFGDTEIQFGDIVGGLDGPVDGLGDTEIQLVYASRPVLGGNGVKRTHKPPSFGFPPSPKGEYRGLPKKEAPPISGGAKQEK